jgi:acyl-CoA synthetase (NDP forming)
MKNLAPFFGPKSIVIIGASRNTFTFNGTLVKNLRESRYKGKIYIVHPEAEEIMGVKCFKSIKNIPEKPELAIVLLGNGIYKTIKALADYGLKYCMIGSDLARNADELETRMKLKKIAEKNNMLIMGPGMIGVINTANNFTSSIIPVRRHIMQKHRRHRKHGSMSFLAESGGLSGALGWWTPTQFFSISKVIHTGHSINVSNADVLQFLYEDPETNVISLFLKNPTQEFIEVLENNSMKKPTLYKMVGKDSEIIEKLNKSGAIEVENYIELFEFAKVFLWCPPPEKLLGDNIGIIGPSSGAIYLLASEMRKHGIHIAPLTPETKEFILDNVGGSTCLEGNPVDFWPPKKFIGTDVCNIYYISSNALLGDDLVDALFVALEFFNEIEFDFEILEEIKTKFPNKPIITVLIHAEKEGRERIINTATKINIPVFVDEVERAIRAYSVLIKYYQHRERKRKK